jgi:single-strand DNA-binding protein
MTDTISVTGLVATDPKGGETNSNQSVASFRLASNARRFNREESKWENANPNWFTVHCYRQLADHVLQSINKGDRVVIRGRLKIRDWDNGQRSGTAVEIDAESIGHDLLFGTTSFERTTQTEEVEEDSEAELQPA